MSERIVSTSVIEVGPNEPGKMFYGLVGTFALVEFGIVAAEMYSIGLTVVPVLLALASLALVIYCVWKCWKIYSFEKEEKSLEQEIKVNQAMNSAA